MAYRCSDAMVECGISVALFSVMFVAGWLACRLFSMFFGCKKIAMISNVLQASSIAAAFPLATLLVSKNSGDNQPF